MKQEEKELMEKTELEQMRQHEEAVKDVRINIIIFALHTIVISKWIF